MNPKRKMGVIELNKRRYHSDVRNLKRLCEIHNLDLMPNTTDTPATWICVLSNSEYEIGEIFANCNDNSESYFLSPQDYEAYGLLN